ncbi:MAG: hypothetical protein J6Y48_14665 [Clostridia bacterium]|nr:hypothetical protein [Clostridia bacterium]
MKDYQELFPEHLRDDVKRTCRQMVFAFFEVVAKLARKEGILPEMKEWICDVLIHS